MRKVTLQEIKQLAQNAKDDLWAVAQSYNRDVKLYLHWSAGHYGQFFNDYHVNIDYDGSLYVSSEDLSEVKSHTRQRNSGAIGIALACCVGATTEDWGSEPPTDSQIEAMAQVVSVLCKVLDLTVDRERVMTHAEAADEDDYGPATTCERWDLWFLPDVAKGEGGNVIRCKAILHQQQGEDN
jgi:hypothetical protein